MTEIEIALREENEQLREQVRQLKEALCPPLPPYPTEFRLTKSERIVLHALMERDFINQEGLEARLYLSNNKYTVTDGAKVFVSRVRAKLRPFGINITIWRGVGYSISPENKAEITRRMERVLRAA